MKTTDRTEPQRSPDAALVIVSRELSAASIVVPMNPASPRRFRSLEVDENGARLRGRDDSDLPLACEREVAEDAARCNTVVVKEIDLQTRREDEYEIEVAWSVPVPGMAR